jgi:hypothetical protein
MSGCNNLESEGLRNRRDMPSLRAMVELKRSVRKGAFRPRFPAAYYLRQRRSRIASRARMHR